MNILFWDMDGVLIDSLGLDFEVINPMLAEKYGPEVCVSRKFLWSVFALAIPEFIRAVLMEVNRFSAQDFGEMARNYEKLRFCAEFALCPGVLSSLKKARALGFPQWVVSNNKVADVKRILERVGIVPYVDCIWGYDANDVVAKKPAPDIYLGAFKSALLQYPDAKMFYVFEDSKLGVASALAARSLWASVPVRVIGVLTGGDSRSDLRLADQILPTLESFTFSS